MKMSSTLQRANRPIRALLPRQQSSESICCMCAHSNRRTGARNFTTAQSVEQGVIDLKTKPTSHLEGPKSANSEIAQPIRTGAFTAPSPLRLAVSLVLSRPPFLTRDLTPFEKAFYFYQRRLDKRLALPFTKAFYFKEGTIAANEWKTKRKGLKQYNPYGELGWADELMIGDKPADDEEMTFDDYIRNTVTGEDVSEIESTSEAEAKKGLGRPLPRESKADLEGDERSLNRAGSRTLYLLVKREGRDKFGWKFPQTDLVGTDDLRETGERALVQACGVNMNTWLVGNTPIGFYNYMYGADYKKPKDDTMIGRKVFFMKARIMAGKPKLSTDKKLGLEDYKWLTKQEIEPLVSKDYWTAIRHFLVER